MPGPMFSFLEDLAAENPQPMTPRERVVAGLIAGGFGLLIVYVGLAVIAPIALLVWLLL